MTINQDVLLDYVMGALTPEEEREVAFYLNEHPEEAREVRDLFEAMADVALNLEPEVLAADAEESLLTRIRLGSDVETAKTQDLSEVSLEVAEVIQLEAQEDTNKERPKQFYMDADFFGKEKTVHLPKQEKTVRPPTWLTGLALAAAIGAFLYLGFRPQVDPAIQQLASLCEQDSSRCDTLSSNNGDLATLVNREDNSLLLVFNEAPPQGQVYQAWEIADGTPQSLGILDGRVLDLQTALGQDSLFGVSIEPRGGSDQPSRTPEFVVYADQTLRQFAAFCEQNNDRCDILTDENNSELGTLAKREDNSLLLVLNQNPPEGQVYQAWEIADGSPQSLGIWEGRVLNIEASLDQDSLFGVSIEPGGGSEQPTSTPILVVSLAS